jgi:hypothetical protein
MMNPELCFLLFVFWNPWGIRTQEIQNRPNRNPENVSAGRTECWAGRNVEDSEPRPQRRKTHPASWTGGFG